MTGKTIILKGRVIRWKDEINIIEQIYSSCCCTTTRKCLYCRQFLLIIACSHCSDKNSRISEYRSKSSCSSSQFPRPPVLTFPADAPTLSSNRLSLSSSKFASLALFRPVRWVFVCLINLHPSPEFNFSIACLRRSGPAFFRAIGWFQKAYFAGY